MNKDPLHKTICDFFSYYSEKYELCLYNLFVTVNFNDLDTFDASLTPGMSFYNLFIFIMIKDYIYYEKNVNKFDEIYNLINNIYNNNYNDIRNHLILYMIYIADDNELIFLCENKILMDNIYILLNSPCELLKNIHEKHKLTGKRLSNYLYIKQKAMVFH